MGSTYPEGSARILAHARRRVSQGDWWLLRAALLAQDTAVRDQVVVEARINFGPSAGARVLFHPTGEVELVETWGDMNAPIWASLTKATVAQGIEPTVDQRTTVGLTDALLPAPPTLDLSRQGPTPSAVAAASSRGNSGSAVRTEDDVPYRARRCREQYEGRVERYVADQLEYGTLASKTTAPHRRYDLLRWPEMCRRAGLDELYVAGRHDVTREQVVAIKRCGIWENDTLRPIFSGMRGFLRDPGSPGDPNREAANLELANDGKIWFLPKGKSDRRAWLTKTQLSLLFALATGRVRIRVLLQGFLGMREDSARDLRVGELRLKDPIPRIAFASKGPDGERMTITVDEEVASILRSWVEAEGLGPNDRVYGVGHSTADADLRKLGKAADLPFPLSGHVLRRTWARITYLASDRTMDAVRKIGKVLGHKSTEQTWHYIGGDYLDMSDAFAWFRKGMQDAAGPRMG